MAKPKGAGSSLEGKAQKNRQKASSEVFSETPRPVKSGARGRPCGSCAEENILEAAAIVFAEKGLQESTVADLLKASGCSRTNFYRFYKNKDEVFEELFGNSMGVLQFQMKQALDQALHMESFDEALIHVVDIYLQVCFSFGKLANVFFREQWSSRAHIVLREKIIMIVHKGLSNMAVNFNRPEPDHLLVEALLAGIDRIVSLQLDSDLDSDASKQKARTTIVKLLSANFA